MKKVYLVMSSGNEVRLELEGVFEKYEDAKKEFNSIKKSWIKWAGHGIEDKSAESWVHQHGPRKGLKEEVFEITTFDDSLEVRLFAAIID